MQQEAIGSKMSNTGAGSWSVFADTVRQGVDTFAATQKMFLDIGLLKRMAGNSAGSLNTEFWDMLEKGVITFAAAQKRLLEYAGQQADAMVKAGREGNSATSMPLSQMAGLAQQAAQALAPKELLDLLTKAQQQTQRLFKDPPSGDPAEHFLNLARQSFEDYMDLQLKLSEQAARLMDDWTRAWQAGNAWQPSVTFEDLARQGVEAFVKAQSEIQGFAFRSSGANWS